MVLLELEWVIHKIKGILKIAANDLEDRKGLDIKIKNGGLEGINFLIDRLRVNIS